MATRRRAFGPLLALIVGIYLLLACLYAVCTPDWQTPDEPAHYNYAATIAAEGHLPQLRAGDYPAAYLEEIKAQRFPPEMSVDSIRYESHQPPAYYVLGAALLRLAPAADVSTRLLLLRLLSAVCGAGALVTLALLARRLLRSDALALGATALVACIPMFVADTAAANNDALAFFALGLVALCLTRPAERRWTTRASIVTGLALGLCLLTKLQAYVAAPLLIGAQLWDVLVGRELTWRRAWRSGLTSLGVALLVALPWLLRNVLTYGWADPLGLGRHNEIVVGQLRTTELIGQVGWPAYLQSYARTTFQSFWGQFGWMAAPLPEHVYLVLALLSLLGLVGLLSGIALWKRASASSRRAVGLLALWALLTTASYLWYNLQFVQFQGRYLFPALTAWAIGLAWGLAQVVQRPRAALIALGAVVLALLGLGIARGDLPLFALASCLAAAAALAVAHRLGERGPWLTLGLAALGLDALTLYSLFYIVVPQLTP